MGFGGSTGWSSKKNGRGDGGVHDDGGCALRVLHESAALSVRLELQLELPAVTLFSSSLVRRPASETRDGGWSNVLRFSIIRARVGDGVAH